MLMVSVTLPWVTESTFTGMLAVLEVVGVLVAEGVAVAVAMAVAVGVSFGVAVGVSAGDVTLVAVGVDVAVAPEARFGLLVSGNLARTVLMSLMVGLAPLLKLAMVNTVMVSVLLPTFNCRGS